MKEGKIWGETSEIYANQYLSIHYLSLKSGGFCSIHAHQKKSNIFYLISGKVAVTKIIEFLPNERVLGDRTELAAGESLRIEPRIYHQFEALEDSKLIEIYEAQLDREDIDRRSHGGMR